MFFILFFYLKIKIVLFEEQKKNGQKSGAAPKKHSINNYQEAEHTYHPKKKAYGKGKNDYVTEYVPKSNK